MCPHARTRVEFGIPLVVFCGVAGAQAEPAAISAAPGAAVSHAQNRLKHMRETRRLFFRRTMNNPCSPASGPGRSSVCNGRGRSLRTIVSAAALCLLFVLGAAPIYGQGLDDPQKYDRGVEFPRPTTAQLDSMLLLGIVPVWLAEDPTLYWPRSLFTVAGRATWRTYMTQAIDGGFGAEGNIAIPFNFTDFGLFLYARANDYTVRDSGWLGWHSGNGERGVLFNGGAGFSLAIPLYNPGFLFPISMGVGSAFFQPQGTAVPAETYLGLEPSLGLRYRMSPYVATAAMVQGAWMVPLRDGNKGIGSWNFSLGVEVSLAPHRHEALQPWVPPLVATAHDVVMLLGKEPNEPLNIFDRNLDFINTEIKPLTAFGWRDLGFRGIVRGVVIASSRAASGNVTALDIELDSADERGFRVWRSSMLQDSTLAMSYLVGNTDEDSASLNERRAVVLDRIRRGDYAYRGPDELGRRYLRAELFPEAKGDLDKVPQVGSRVTIVGGLWWDGDGHLEIHPQKPSDIRLESGEFLDSDDELILE